MRVRKSDSRETKHAHVRVGELKNSLREKNQANRKTNQKNARRASGRVEKETEK